MSNEESKVVVRPNTEAYAKGRSASGATTFHSGDAVASGLEGATLDEVYRVASKALGETQKALHEKYDHLNPGMQRMNLGNRIRGAITAAEKAEEGTGEALLAESLAPVQGAIAKRIEEAEAAAAERAAAAEARAKEKAAKEKAAKAA